MLYKVFMIYRIRLFYWFLKGVYINLHLSAASSPTATLFRLQTCFKARYAGSQIYITDIFNSSGMQKPFLRFYILHHLTK